MHALPRRRNSWVAEVRESSLPGAQKSRTLKTTIDIDIDESTYTTASYMHGRQRSSFTIDSSGLNLALHARVGSTATLAFVRSKKILHFRYIAECLVAPPPPRVRSVKIPRHGTPGTHSTPAKHSTAQAPGKPLPHPHLQGSLACLLSRSHGQVRQGRLERVQDGQLVLVLADDVSQGL